MNRSHAVAVYAVYSERQEVMHRLPGILATASRRPVSGILIELHLLRNVIFTERAWSVTSSIALVR
jgi:hypothetical protein